VQGNKGLCVNCKLIQIHSKPTTHKNRARSRSKQSKKPSKHGMGGKSGVKKILNDTTVTDKKPRGDQDQVLKKKGKTSLEFNSRKTPPSRTHYYPVPPNRGEGVEVMKVTYTKAKDPSQKKG